MAAQPCPGPLTAQAPGGQLFVVSDREPKGQKQKVAHNIQPQTPGIVPRGSGRVALAAALKGQNPPAPILFSVEKTAPRATQRPYSN